MSFEVFYSASIKFLRNFHRIFKNIQAEFFLYFKEVQRVMSFLTRINWKDSLVLFAISAEIYWHRNDEWLPLDDCLVL